MPRQVTYHWICATCKMEGQVSTSNLSVLEDDNAKALLIAESHRLKTAAYVGKWPHTKTIDRCTDPVITTRYKLEFV